MYKKIILLIIGLLVFTGLAVFNAFAGQVALIWDANTEPDLAGYKVYYGAAGYAGYDSSVDVGDVTSHIITNLSEGVTYRFTATAYNNSGSESDYADAVSETIADTTAPQVTSVKSISDTEVRVTFSEEVEAAGAQTIGNYAIDYAITANQTVLSLVDNKTVSQAVLSADNKTVTLSVSPLTEGVTYLLNVSNINDRAKTPNMIIRSADRFTYTAIDPALVGWWKFEEGSGTTAADSAGNSSGTINGAVWSTAPARESVLSFDGADDYIEIQHNDEYLIDSGTIALWINPVQVNIKQTFISKDSGGYDTGGHLSVYIESNAGAGLRLQSASRSYAISSSSGILTANTWHHVAVSFGSAGIKYYVDGSEVASHGYTGGLGTTSGGTGNYEPIAIGAGTSGSGNKSVTPLRNYFKGLIDEVRVYNRALSSREISDLAGVTPPPADTTPPIAVISADSTSVDAGTAINFDASGSSDDSGTIAGYAWDFGDGQTGTGEIVSHSYSSAADYTVTLTVTDDAGNSDTAALPVSVSDIAPPPQNTAPQAIGQSLTVTLDTAKTVTLSAADIDNDPLTYTIVTQPANGSINLGAIADDNQITYTPDAGYTGSDSFSFTANDGAADSNTAVVSVTVNQASNINVNYPNWPLEILSWDLTKAYPEVLYNWRLGIKGGAYPYNFRFAKDINENAIAPAGMTIDAMSGEINWIAPKNESSGNQVSIIITDSQGAKLTHNYAIDVTKTGFYFVAEGGVDNDSADGSESNPWRTPVYAHDQARNHAPSDIIYVKSGTYSLNIKLGYRNGLKSPLIWMEWPGDNVIFRRTSVGINTRAADQVLFQGFEFTNGGAKMFWIGGKSSNVIWRNNIMHGISSTGANNPSFIFSEDSGSYRPIDGRVQYNKFVVQNNIFYNQRNTQNHGGGMVLYNMMNMLAEDNEFYDLQGGGIIDKDDGYQNTFRKNYIHDTVSGIMLASQYSQGQINVHHNFIVNSGVIIGSQPGYIRDIYVHQNTLYNGSVNFGGIVSDARSTNINVYNNIIYQQGSGFLYKASPKRITNPDESYYYTDNYVFDGSVNVDNNLLSTLGSYVYGKSWGIQNKTFESWQIADKDKNGVLANSADPVIDSNGLLTSSYSQYLGTYGWQVSNIPLGIKTTTLPQAKVGIAYSQTLQAQGGQAPYAWSVSSGSLPNGLTLNATTGQITGTPTIDGDFIFTVEVTDANLNTATQSLSISVVIPDTEAPVVEVISPNDNDIVTVSTITVTGTASDNIGVDSVAVKGTSAATSDGYANWSAQITLSEGSNIITATAQDAAGNSTTTPSITITYEVPPGTYTKEWGEGVNSNHKGTIEDTTINVNATNNSASETLNTYTWPENSIANAIILKWDLSAIPAGATIQSAQLEMYQTGSGGDAAYDLTAHRITGYNPDIASVTGYTYDGVNAWTPYAGLANNIPLAQNDILTAEDTQSMNSSLGYKAFNVTQMVQGWVGGSFPNYGMLINSDSTAASDSYRFFASSEAADQAQRPKLVISYNVGSTVPAYTIAASAGANGSISPSGAVTVNSGSNRTFTITPASGYHVADVLIDGVSVGAVTAYTFSNVTAGHTIAVSFAIDTFTITASAGANGSISPSGAVTVNTGSNRTFSISANTGYHVADVLVDGVSVGAVTTYTFTNVTTTHTIAATFVIDTYTITASAGANGTISPSGDVTVNSGSNRTFSISANTGYHVADVLVDGVSVGAITTYTFTNLTAAHTISAGFVIDTYTVPPVIETLISDNTGTVPFEVTFVVNAHDKDGYIVKYEWDFHGRGRYDTISHKNGDAAFTYKTPGDFNPTIKITDNDGLTAEAAVTIHALPAPESPAAFITTDKTTGTAITFTGNGNSADPDGNIVKYEWDFENNGTYKYPSASKQIIYTYTLPGDYEARLRITDNNGLMAETSVDITVRQSGNMKVAITKTSPGHDPAYVLDEITYQAAVTGITHADNRQITWQWDFDGDGTYDKTIKDNETPKPVTHTYTDAGYYTVKLKITTPDNFSAETDDLQIRIKDTGTPYPEADFTITDYDTGAVLAAPYEWTAPFAISLTDNSTAASSITAYEWDFDGDGIYDSSQQNPAQTYYSPGTYFLTLKIIGANGLRDKKTVPVYITGGTTYRIRITDPQDNLTITGDALTLIAETDIDHPEAYRVLFYYKEQNPDTWSASETAKKIGASYAAGIDTTSMPDGQYEITAQLIDQNRTTLVTSSPVSITIDKSSIASDIQETTQTDSITKTVKIYRNITNKINIFEADTENITKADIPANVLDNPEDALEIKILDTHTPGLDSAAVQSAREYREYTLTSGQTQFLTPVTITIPYPDADSDGFIDGTAIQESSLAVYWYNAPAGEWEETTGSVIFPDRNHVQLQTRHFSVFGLGGSPVDNSGGRDETTDTEDPSTGGPELELEDVFQGGGADGGGGGCFIEAVSY